MRRFDVELFIVHPTLDAAEITATLGLEPCSTHRVGDQRRTPRGTLLQGRYPDTRWRYSIRYDVDDQYFAQRITDVIDRLAPHKEFLGKIRAAGGTSCIIVQFLGDGYFGDEISRDTLAKLIALNLDLAIECFVEPQS